jgi:hypothetical protein
MAAGPTQLLHGVRLSGDVSVPGAVSGSGGAAEFEVRLHSAEDVDPSPPDGEPVAALDWPAAGYAAALRGDLLTIRFYETAEFRVDLAGGTIDATPAPGRGETLVPVLLAGGVLAIALGLRGAIFLHAAAVELDGDAIAVAGPSAAGKSTVAALLCAAGATLICDDASRAATSDDGILIHRGPGELRLRPQAAGLADRLGGATRTTTDGRLAVEAETTSAATSRLQAVVFPRWSDDLREPSVSRLRPRAALEALLRCPRVIGWRAVEPVRSHFALCTRIAETVPAFELELPRGRLEDPGFPDAVAAALRGADVLDAARAKTP